MTRFSLLIATVIISSPFTTAAFAGQAPFGPSRHKAPAASGTCTLSRSCSPGASIDVVPYVATLGKTGRLRLEVLPADAVVYVDGVYAGRAEQFDGRSMRATMASGRHRIDVRADGYQDFVFDTRITRSKPTVERIALVPAAGR